ncbi:MAG: NAD(P)/FAD-dependent oxidoreductase [Flavobacteriales bacterium]|nr:NAD(P)/FAD-dependent oxidoreductase [Flavobacteriales bacterium]
MRIVVIGGGAAGFFAAISARTHHPGATVTLVEKSDKLLAKVRVSGGGRCNVTHACPTNKELARHYPRGERFLRKAFEQFTVKDTIAWFRDHGVELKTEADGRMFPVSDDSETIIEALLGEAERLGVKVLQRTPVKQLERVEGRWSVHTEKEVLPAERVIIATGGSPKLEGLQWLADLGHRIVPPVPSLFTFNLPKEPLRELMGVVADPVLVRIAGTKLESTGPLLVTHWGFSGPAVLRLSAWGARELQAANYTFTVNVNWTGGRNEELIRNELQALRTDQAKRKLKNAIPFLLPARIWEFLLRKVQMDPELACEHLGRKELNRLVNALTNDAYHASGKTTFKEEFVTAGGVSLEDVEPRTMQSLVAPGLYFAGEVLDVDGITGGFNFQAAWTTGWIAGKLETRTGS